MIFAIFGFLLGPLLSIISGSFLSLLGFTQLGIAYGSFAALIQSTIGYVISGSVFAFLQSIAATGYLFSLSFMGIMSTFTGIIGIILDILFW